MNNKRHGTKFEKEVVDYLSGKGFWVHFMSPDERCAQPFDIIAVKSGRACAIECKTLTTNKRYFTINRLEDNQVLAFEKWLACGNIDPIIYVEYGDAIKAFTYLELKEKKRIDMRGEEWNPLQ